MAIIPLVPVPPGTAFLADQRSRTKWTVHVTGLHLGRTPVTAGQYSSVMGAAPQLIESSADPTSAAAARRPTCPAVDVSWLDAVEFCNVLSVQEHLQPAYLIGDQAVEWDQCAAGYRLPSEAEWTYACRAGTSGARYGPLDEIAWYEANSRGSVQPVAGKKPNPFGLYDMLGNVFEWCWDMYDPDVYGDYRVLKGGGWADPAWSCRAGVRRRSSPELAIDDVGFRVARNR